MDLSNLPGLSAASEVGDDDISTVTTPSSADPSTIIDVEEYQEPDVNSRNRLYIITCMANVGDQPVPSVTDLNSYFRENTVVRWAATCEKCPTTQRTHYHMFVQFKHQRTAPQLKALIERKTHFRSPNVRFPPMCRGAAMNKHILAMHNYCTKEETRFPGTIPVTFGPPPPTVPVNPPAEPTRRKPNKSRQDQADDRNKQIIDLIMSNPIERKWCDILHADEQSRLLLGPCSWAKQFHHERTLKVEASIEPRTIQNVIVLCGAAGTGKTTLATSGNLPDLDYTNADVWSQTQGMGKWFGNARFGARYRNEKVIVIDEYHMGHPITFTDFKSLANVGHQGEQVQLKYGSIRLNHETIIFTSNQMPYDWFRNQFNQQVNYDAFVRRVTKFLWFPSHRPNGEPNIPTHADGPYYEEKEFPDRCPPEGLVFN